MCVASLLLVGNLKLDCFLMGLITDTGSHPSMVLRFYVFAPKNPYTTLRENWDESGCGVAMVGCSMGKYFLPFKLD